MNDVNNNQKNEKILMTFNKYTIVWFFLSISTLYLTIQLMCHKIIICDLNVILKICSQFDSLKNWRKYTMNWCRPLTIPPYLQCVCLNIFLCTIGFSCTIEAAHSIRSDNVTVTVVFSVCCSKGGKAFSKKIEAECIICCRLWYWNIFIYCEYIFHHG